MVKGKCRTDLGLLKAKSVKIAELKWLGKSNFLAAAHDKFLIWYYNCASVKNKIVPSFERDF